MVAMVRPDGQGSLPALRVCVLFQRFLAFPGVPVRNQGGETRASPSLLQAGRNSQTRNVPCGVYKLTLAFGLNCCPRLPHKGLAMTSGHCWSQG